MTLAVLQAMESTALFFQCWLSYQTRNEAPIKHVWRRIAWCISRETSSYREDSLKETHTLVDGCWLKEKSDPWLLHSKHKKIHLNRDISGKPVLDKNPEST